MQDFTEAEKQLLIAIKSKLLRENLPIKDELEEFGRNFFDDDLVDWTDAYQSLENRALLRVSDGKYSLTDEADRYATLLRKKKISSGFDEWMMRSDKSDTYGRFCRRVYGMDLCQCSMADMEQLDKLIAVLRLSGENSVLDLGCGVGKITEYVSDMTGANITGVDIAEEVIKRADDRTSNKRHRLSYAVCDMNQLNYPPASFDTIISIDTLYFVDKLDDTIAAMRSIIGDSGQMGIFYSQMVKREDSREKLKPDHTDLAESLKRNGLSYTVWCFTENEYEIWRRQKAVAEELKSDFESEGYVDLYESRIREAERLLEFVNDRRENRYLYHVTPGTYL